MRFLAGAIAGVGLMIGAIALADQADLVSVRLDDHEERITALESGHALATITVADEHDEGYDRSTWGYESRKARAALDCQSDEDVDHVVALEEAHQSGGYEWTQAQRKEFANDLANLRCVESSANRSRGSDDLAEYGDGPHHYLCLIDEVAPAVKLAHGLSMDRAEFAAHSQFVCDADDQSAPAPTAQPAVEPVEKWGECRPWGNGQRCKCTATGTWRDPANCP